MPLPDRHTIFANALREIGVPIHDHPVTGGPAGHFSRVPLETLMRASNLGRMAHGLPILADLTETADAWIEVNGHPHPDDPRARPAG
jgi:hypothetical protein